MTLLEVLIALGSVQYVFPEGIDERIVKTCREKGYIALEVPERGCLKQIPNFSNYMLSEIEKTIEEMKYSGCFAPPANIIMIRNGDFIGHPKEDLELMLWHEIGHLTISNHKDEEGADGFALIKMKERYGKETAFHIYRHWLFKEYELNRVTKHYKPFDKPEDMRYLHRKKLLDDYIEIGLEHFADDFD